LLDTCVVIDLPLFDRYDLPGTSVVSAITLAELSYGVSAAKSPLSIALRAEIYADTKAWMKPLPFDVTAADRFGELAALTIAAGRSPRPRRLDLMIAATAVVHGLPLFTSNPDDFRGLEPVLTVVPVYPAPSPR